MPVSRSAATSVVGSGWVSRTSWASWIMSASAATSSWRSCMRANDMPTIGTTATMTLINSSR